MNKAGNENLSILIQKLFFDKELAEKFSKCKTLDEFYNFCIGVQGGYSKEELRETLYVLGSIDWKDLDQEFDNLEDKKLGMVVGGSNFNSSKKITAGILSLLSLFPISFFNNQGAHAASNYNSPTYSKQNIENSRVAKILKYLSIAAGATLVIGAAAYFYKRSNKNLVDAATNGGLTNPGNACYINATLQQLYSMPEFKNKVMIDNSGNKKIEVLKTIFKNMDDGKILGSSETEKLLEGLGYDGSQQDSHEFLTRNKYIADILEKLDFAADAPAISPEQYRTVQEYFDDRTNFINSPSIGKERFFVPLTKRPSDAGVKDFVATEVISTPFGRQACLVGAVVKTGDINFGHYYSYKLIDGQWYCFNDRYVSAVDMKTVMEDIQTNGRVLVYSYEKS